MRTLGPSPTVGLTSDHVGEVFLAPLRSRPSIGCEHFRTSFVSSTFMAPNGRTVGLAPWKPQRKTRPWMGQ